MYDVCKRKEDMVNWEWMADKYLGETPGKVSQGFPQVSSDLNVKRTMNFVWVLMSVMDVMWMCQW